jgi:hypothetical protein
MKLLHNLTLKNIYEGRYLLLATAVLAGFLTWPLGNPYFYRAIPLGLFWVIAALAGFSPDTIATVLAELHKAGPDVIQGVARVLVVLMFMVVAMHWVLGLSRFGFIDSFDEATGTALRKHCKVAAEGSIVLVRWTNGVLHFNVELAHMRPAKNK